MAGPIRVNATIADDRRGTPTPYISLQAPARFYRLSQDEALTLASDLLRAVADSYERTADGRGDGHAEASIRALATDVWEWTIDGKAELAADGLAPGGELLPS
jgi:hypothetical protein